MKEQMSRKKKKVKENPSVYRYSVNLNEMENIEFHSQMEKTGMTNISKFIKVKLLEKEVKVVKVDKAAMDFYMRLTTLYTQYQKIGVNYNQIVKALKTNFGEKRARILLFQLEKHTIDLITISKQIIQITHEYETKWLQK